MTDLGRFVWYDICVPDVDAAISFYTKLLDWEIDAWGEGEEKYQMFRAARNPIGGFHKIPQEQPAGWLGYVAVEDVAATLELAKSLGAEEVQGITEIDQVGTFAIIQDPQGAHIAPFKPMGGDGPPEPECRPAGEIDWRELNTTVEAAEAFPFYEKLFGWKQGNVQEMPYGAYLHFKIENGGAGGMMKMPPGAPPMAMWVYYAKVEDIDAKAALCKELGGQVHHGPVEIPMGRFVVLGDPQGAVFSLWQPKEA